jgi:hypothetical protein
MCYYLNIIYSVWYNKVNNKYYQKWETMEMDILTSNVTGFKIEKRIHLIHLTLKKKLLTLLTLLATKMLPYPTFKIIKHQSIL